MKALVLMLAAVSTLSVPALTAQSLLPPNTVTAETRQQIAKDYEMKGDIARAREQYGSAVNWYLLATRYNNKDVSLYNKLGIAQMKVGDLDQARRTFGLAVKADPASVDALNNLGAAYCLQKRYKQAVRSLKQALAIDESKAVTHLNLAEAWMGQKQVDRAMTEYARALELDADILNSSDKEGVFAQVQTPEQRAMVDFMIAKAYVKRGNLEGALDYLRHAKEGHFRQLSSVWEDPAFAPLWKDARLAEIVKPPKAS
ncbi:MAG TPA: tetratricopeptide repeat protein [Acidobacteriaceae bacterium]|nr:tetratricopeptide repeat protein [Acidobacteriaceae bacterium]